MTAYADRFWTSRDGLKLHYREYVGREDRPPVICLPGLTRNARDFETLAERLAGEWRVLCPENRGRGDSAYAKDSATYNPLQYVQDLGALFEEAGIERFVAIGTSLGGLLTMIMAMTTPEKLAGAVLNDIGPEINPEGLERIRGYVGQGPISPRGCTPRARWRNRKDRPSPISRPRTGWRWPSAAWWWAATGGSCSITT